MSLVGKIVEYIEQGRFFCAVVIEEEDKRLRLVNQNGREALLPHGRIVHAASRGPRPGASREDLQKELKAVDEARRALMANVELKEIWELASAEADEGFAPRFLAELCFGPDTGDDHEAALLRCVFEDRLYFKYKEGRIIAHAAEVVEQLLAGQEKERRREDLLASGAANLKRLWDDLETGPWPERDQCLDLIREYYLHGHEAPDSETARELLKRAELTRPHDPYYLLIKAGVFAKNENIPLLRIGLPVDFSAPALELAEERPAAVEVLLAEGRKDFRTLPIVTIDGEATRDLDDALHIEKKGENFLVGIHIADVAWLARPGDALFREARERISSLYLPDRRIAMLPEALSEQSCSLLAGEPRAAMSFMVLLSADAEVVDYDIVASVVEVKERLSYEETERRLATDPALQELCRLSVRLLARRIGTGALLMPIPDVNISIGPDGSVSVTQSEVDSRARCLVAEFMVLANTLAARFVADRQAPGLFRSQPEPHRRLLQGCQKDLFLNFRQRKFLAAAKLSTVPAPHACVGATQYTTVTSPIRRFLDLVMQHQIFSLLRGKGPLFTEAELLDLGRAITVNQTRLGLARHLRHRYWLLKYLEAFQGRRVPALVLDKSPRRVLVVLTETLLEADLPAQMGRGMEPGDIISVKVAKVSPLDDLIKLEI